MPSIKNDQFNPNLAFLNNTYIVPVYQREYVWGEREVDSLLNDVAEQVSSDATLDYFIGMVLVSPVDGAPPEEGRCEVIDGQQRLTTLFLLLIALKQRMFEAKQVVTVSGIDKLLVNTTWDGEGDAKIGLRLTPQYDDGEDTIRAILESPHDTAAARAVLVSKGTAIVGSAQRLLEAYDYIIGYLAKSYPNTSDLKRFWSFFSTKVQFIQIAAPVGTALKIFETINERGVSLDAMDLLKNLLFVQVKKAQYEQLKSRWKDITKPLAKAKLKPLRFLRYFIMANYTAEKPENAVVREDQIYDWFVDRDNVQLAGYKKDPLGFVQKLVTNASWYVHLNKNCRPDGTPSPALSRLRRMTGAAFSLHSVMLLAAAPLPADLFEHLVEQMESYLFSVLYTFTPSKELEREFSIRADDLRDAAAIEDKKKQIAAIDAFVARHWQSFIDSKARELHSHLLSYSNGTTQRKFRTHYLLARLSLVVDNAFKGGTPVYGLDAYTGLHIEHILPDTPDAGYDAIWNTQPANVGMKYDEAKESLGNLMLLEATINISNQNNYYEEKRPTYIKSGVYLTRSQAALTVVGKNSSANRLNDKFLQSFDTWDAKQIVKRQEMLARLAAVVWNTRSFGEALKF